MTTEPINRSGTAIVRLSSRVTVVVCCSSLCACTTLNPVTVSPQNEAINADVDVAKPGDQLVVKLKAGSALEITLVSVQDQVITGSLAGQTKQVSIPMNEIASLERHEVSKARTAIFLGVALGVVALVVFVRLAAGLAGT